MRMGRISKAASIARVRIEHVRRGDNKAADALANRAIDQRLPVPEWLELELPVG